MRAGHWRTDGYATDSELCLDPGVIAFAGKWTDENNMPLQSNPLPDLGDVIYLESTSRSCVQAGADL